MTSGLQLPAMPDISSIRGTHYRLNGDAERTARELGWGRRLGLNAVRFWLAPQAEWRADPEGYVARVRDFVRIAFGQGYRSMPILFNGNGLDPQMLEGPAWDACAAFAEGVVTALKDEPGVLAWDIMNEPTYNPWVGGAPDDAEKGRRREKTVAFLGRAAALVRRTDPSHPITIGCQNPDEAERTEPLVDVISFHDYSSTRGAIEEKYSRMEALGRRAGKPVLQSETGCTAYGNGYDMALEACRRHGFGFFFFNLVIGGYTESFHGVFYEDGAIRDPAAVAAIMGFHRQRDISRIIPASPFKPGREERLDAIVAALRAAIDAASGRHPATSAVAALLEETERAANYLECCELVPMAVPPSARILAWRASPRPPVAAIRRLARSFAAGLEKARFRR